MTTADGTVESDQLRREFKEHHVSMIAVAGAIGTGLIIGTGTGLVRGGPGSLLVAYSVVGAVVFFVMTALGEMATMYPMDKGFGGYATRFVDPALGYATGWNYFFKYAVVLANNLTAAGIIIQYWRPDLNVAIFVTVFLVVIISVNLLHVSFFGEAEFWMSSLKLLVMVTLILTCFIISMGGQPSHKRIGFAYWKDPGAFGSYLLKGDKGRFLGWWAAMIQSTFAYTGTEVVGVAFGEAPNPKKTIPKAIRQTLGRIVFFYIIGALTLGMAVPYTNDRLIGGTKQKTGAGASPFVIAVQLAGIPIFPDVINACLLVFVLSAANSDIYIGSRTLFGLAHDRQAPEVFKRTNRSGVPIWGVAFTSAFAALAYMNASKSSSQVFGYLVSLVTVFGALNWINVLVTYIQFVRGLRAQGIPRSAMPYRGSLQPYGSYFALFMTILLIFFNGYAAFIPSFTTSTFITSYIGVVIYLGNIAFYKIWRRTQYVRPAKMDLTTGRLE
ncbi:amino acid permease/ SLC12A domain-containing protein [Mariannaea sp. PMI_226]|nr:amino acid permease/ SLC12A domain-containing protein [Mariannaea sp. PMI_226]